MVSNPDKKNIKLGKAGRKRWMGVRPVVRGVAMNPVDHPHGGGEGRTSGGRNPVSRKGFSAKGKKTRNNKRTDKYILKRRKKKIMSRSVWKGPFVDMYLMKKAETVKSSGRNDVIKTWSRRSTILPEFVGLTFGVHNGKSTYQLR